MNVSYDKAHALVGYGVVYVARNHAADLKMLGKLTHDEKMERLELAAAKAGVHRNPDYACATCGKQNHVKEIPF